MQIVRASKSLVVRMTVASAAMEAPFESAAPAVRQGLRAAARLLEWYERHIAPSHTS